MGIIITILFMVLGSRYSGIIFMIFIVLFYYSCYIPSSHHLDTDDLRYLIRMVVPAVVESSFINIQYNTIQTRVLL